MAVIGLDTNVLVRYLVQDDPVQSEIANSIMENEVSLENRGFVSCVVLCEVVWVLKRAYRQPKSRLLEVIRLMFETDAIEIERRAEVWRAYRAFVQGDADFSDYLIAEVAHSHGVDKVYTFDTSCADSGYFQVLTS